MNGKQFTVFWVTALLAASLLLYLISGCDDAGASPFGYKYLGSFKWVPGSTRADTFCLDLELEFGDEVNLLTMYSSADFYVNVMPVNTLANGEWMHADPSEAQLDSLYDFAQLIPAAGKSIYGDLYWVVAPVPSDTLRFDAYTKDLP